MNIEIFLPVLRFLLAFSLYVFLFIALLSMWRSFGRKDRSQEVAIPHKPLSLIDQEGNKKHSISGNFIMGRHPGCDLVLEDEAVSNRHARIHWENAQWWLTDLSSRNGTLLNGAPLEEASVLTENDAIVIGHTQFSITFHA
jgi:pSer/pThr/pTyr-binding forkhead associated (FHA) protein